MSRAGEQAPDAPIGLWTSTLDDFHSADPPKERCLELARLAARTDLPVPIVGESGTGKTRLARTIHNSSARARPAPRPHARARRQGRRRTLLREQDPLVLAAPNRGS